MNPYRLAIHIPALREPSILETYCYRAADEVG